MSTWHNPEHTPPEPLHDVLLAYIIDRPEEHDGRTHEASEGYRLPDSCDYVFATGHEISGDRVYAWTEIPIPPAPAELGIDWVCTIAAADDTTQPGDDAIIEG